MLIDAGRLASLPTSGARYTAMKKSADTAMATMDLSEPASSASPWLPNYVDPSTGIGKGATTLAAALVYARTGEVRYRDYVIKVNRFVIGSENSKSTNGTGDNDKMLAVMRQISAYIMAADLVGMDPNVTGSRAGSGSTVWKTWLAALRTKQVGTTANKDTIIENNYMATNHSTWGFAARIAIDIYLGDKIDLAAAVERVKLFTGEIKTGTPWIKSLAYDATWSCAAGAPAGSFVAINSSACGPEKDGVIVEDASRSAFAFPKWDKQGIDYSFHGYAAQLVAAVLLDRQGYDVWNWGDRAFKRVMDRLDRLGVATGAGRVTVTHVSWIPQHFYGVKYPTVTPNVSDTLGYTDWLYGTAATPAPPVPPVTPPVPPVKPPVPPVKPPVPPVKPPAPPVKPPAPLPPSSGVTFGQRTAGPVWTAMSADRKRASRFRLSSTASFTSIEAHLDGRGAATGSQLVRGVIYSNLSNAPNKRLATTAAVRITAGRAPGRVTLTFNSPVRLTSNPYWLGLHSGGKTVVARYAATTTSRALRSNTAADVFTDGSSSPFGAVSTDNKQMSIAAIGK